eukprot:TRINITY_DN11266_c0_g1_i1.p1 TRINITY_DN11266_c0_g1~~TRINITY_DN11266_c0_g1_i1.p1  ORF type:complete len:244 (-),score=54.06 TRINITY_DN11266_c0_g1_i1:76-807(-)
MNIKKIGKTLKYGIIGYTLKEMFLCKNQAGIKLNAWTGKYKEFSPSFFNFKIPYLHQITYFNYETQIVSLQQTVLSKDLIPITLKIKYSMKPNYQFNELTQTKYGNNFEKILFPAQTSTTLQQFLNQNSILELFKQTNVIEKSLKEALTSPQLQILSAKIEDIIIDKDIKEIAEEIVYLQENNQEKKQYIDEIQSSNFPQKLVNKLNELKDADKINYYLQSMNLVCATQKDFLPNLKHLLDHF